jgi:hypothetical protein
MARLRRYRVENGTVPVRTARDAASLVVFQSGRPAGCLTKGSNFQSVASLLTNSLARRPAGDCPDFRVRARNVAARKWDCPPRSTGTGLSPSIGTGPFDSDHSTAAARISRAQIGPRAVVLPPPRPTWPDATRQHAPSPCSSGAGRCRLPASDTTSGPPIPGYCGSAGVLGIFRHDDDGKGTTQRGRKSFC